MNAKEMKRVWGRLPESGNNNALWRALRAEEEMERLREKMERLNEDRQEALAEVQGDIAAGWFPQEIAAALENGDEDRINRHLRAVKRGQRGWRDSRGNNFRTSAILAEAVKIQRIHNRSRG